MSQDDVQLIDFKLPSHEKMKALLSGKIIKEDGTPHRPALAVLDYIVRKFTPTRTGKKKFKGHLLSFRTSDLMAPLNYKRASIRAGLRYLRSIYLIDVEYIPKPVKKRLVLLMHIRLNVDLLRKMLGIEKEEQ